MNKSFKGELVLLITATIWGLAFIFQSTAADVIGAFTFNGVRFLLGALSLLPLFVFNRQGIDYHKCLKLGIALGITIALAANLQQLAMPYVTSAKAGFITSLYMIFVPIIGFIFFKEKVTLRVALALLIALIGLFLLTGADLSFETADLLVIFCAFFFGLQISLVGHFGADVNSVALSFVQYVVAGLFSLVLALFLEDIKIQAILDASISLLYTGILSTGVAYTLQIVGQRHTPAYLASIIMSLEAVVALFGGMIFLHETLSASELIGCALMLAAVLIAQRRKKNGSK